MSLIISEDCFCQGYLHEKRRYPREGLQEKKLQKGDVVEYVKEWGNFYGAYLRVSKDGIEYDLLLRNIEDFDRLKTKNLFDYQKSYQHKNVI